MASNNTLRRVQIVLRHLTTNAAATAAAATPSATQSNGPPTPGRTVRGGDTVQVHVQGHAQGNPSIDAGMFDANTTTFKVAPNTTGPLQPALSLAVLGMQQGERKEFFVQPTDAAHPQPKRDEALVVTVPTGGAKVKVGATVRLQHQGTFRLATVVSTNAKQEQATVDMNDPLAGQVLRYTVHVQDLNATVDLTTLLFPTPLVPVPNKTFTLKELLHFNGQNNAAIYMGVNGYVFDMTAGSKFYGPGGTYGFMAGHDATLALAKFSMNPLLLDQSWALKDMHENELHTLAKYIQTFQNKYPIVGRLVM